MGIEKMHISIINKYVLTVSIIIYYYLRTNNKISKAITLIVKTLSMLQIDFLHWISMWLDICLFIF